MLPALLKYSSAAGMLQFFPPEDRNLHSEENADATSAPLAENRAMDWNDENEDDDEDANICPGILKKATTIDASLLDLLSL